ncbi:hypothetical protein JF544_01830 [Halobacillus kuroshimensis]|uniref:Uncharacterized protein n=1 Tax=Halobacillus kuroshimensis TaxID=302481 RepID=A0ABS3DRI8_9BACI|nr:MULTISPECIES: hypothetical protein [Halobacillus]MBN8233960.1 hypothetical protein [Halobacillus kuroshimensis]
MMKMEVGQLVKDRCTSCLHHQLKVIKVVQKNFDEKVTYVVWTQCPECGNNDHSLMPAES